MSAEKKDIVDELKRGKTSLPSDDYFAELKQHILQRIDTTPKTIPLYRKPWFMTSAAASFLLLITTLLYPWNKAIEQPKLSLDWNSVSRTELLAYIDDHIDEFDSDLLAQQLDTIPSIQAVVRVYNTGNLRTDQHTRSAKKQENLFKDIDKEDILNYLEEEAIDWDDEF